MKNIQNIEVVKTPYTISKNTGLLIIDEVNGFCTVGSGNLAPIKNNKQISTMIQETSNLAKTFENKSMPISLFLDNHQDERPEHPFPPHCIKGSGEELLVSELDWLMESNALKIKKDCINGFIGAIEKETQKNVFIEWIKKNQIESLIVTGICTDICVLDFVLTCMSAINHQVIQPLNEVAVYSKACATYDMQKEDVNRLGLDNSMVHDQNFYHEVGLKIMQMRGAIIADKIIF